MVRTRATFGRELTLVNGVNNYATSTHQLYPSEVVVLASNSQHTAGVLASDVQQTATGSALTASRLQADKAPAAATGPAFTQRQAEIQPYPNPFSNQVNIRFALPTDGSFTLNLYNSNLVATGYQQQGTARAGTQQVGPVKGDGLGGGIYYARLQTLESTQTIRLLLEK